jgi:hypothetical protein
MCPALSPEFADSASKKWKFPEDRTGMGWHDGKIADLDGDGRMDLLNKPYTWNAPRVDVWLNRSEGVGNR